MKKAFTDVFYHLVEAFLEYDRKYDFLKSGDFLKKLHERGEMKGKTPCE